MAKVNSVGISLPIEIISRIDAERGDIPRSRYILGVLRDTYTKRNGLKEEGRCNTATKNSNSQDSPDCEIGTLQSSESELLNPKSQNSNLTQVNNHLCDGSGCSREATKEIEVSVGELGVMKLNLCESCIPKFKQNME